MTIDVGEQEKQMYRIAPISRGINLAVFTAMSLTAKVKLANCFKLRCFAIKYPWLTKFIFHKMFSTVKLQKFSCSKIWRGMVCNTRTVFPLPVP